MNCLETKTRFTISKHKSTPSSFSGCSYLVDVVTFHYSFLLFRSSFCKYAWVCSTGLISCSKQMNLFLANTKLSEKREIKTMCYSNADMTRHNKYCAMLTPLRSFWTNDHLLPPQGNGTRKYLHQQNGLFLPSIIFM